MSSYVDSDPIPSYFDFVRGVYLFAVKTIKDDYLSERKLTPEEEKWHYFNFEVFDLILVLLLAAIFTVIRQFATDLLFKPLAVKYGLTSTNQKKMPESAWKFIFYVGAWSLTFYVVILSGNYRVFQNPSCVWDNWDLNKVLPNDIYLMYAIQSGFYAHSLYSTLFLDTWRKDSVVMMVHHILTLVLIFVSYSLRYHNIGALVILLHDICDIQLEFTKLNVYFKSQHGNLVKIHESLANLTFFCFTITWFVSRLYYYPLKVMYSATSVVMEKQLILPGAISINLLLWILLAMNIYWFLFIVGFLLRVATGQVKEVDDTREYDVEEKFSQKLSAKLESVSGSLEEQSNGNEVTSPAKDLFANGGSFGYKAIGKKRVKKDD